MAENQNPNAQQAVRPDEKKTTQTFTRTLNPQPKPPASPTSTIKPSLPADKTNNPGAQNQPVNRQHKQPPNSSAAANSAGQPPKSSNPASVAPGNQSASSHKFNYQLKNGDTDPSGAVIKEVCARSDEKYLIYYLEDYQIKLFAEDEGLISRNSDVSQIYFQITEYLNPHLKLKKHYVKSIIFALKMLYDGNPQGALSSLKTIQANVIRSLKRETEIAYLAGAVSLTFLSLTFYLFFYLYGNLNDFGHIVFRAVVFSALGGFFSVYSSVGKLLVDVQHTYFQKMLFGAQRIFIAMLSGVMTYFFIESGLFLAFIPNLNNVNIYYVAFFLSGFSERLIPNLMLDLNGNERKGIATFFAKKQA